jgi:hypothetical protein
MRKREFDRDELQDSLPLGKKTLVIIIYIMLTLTSITVFFSLFLSSYKSFNLLQNISFLSQDGWCLREEPRIGVHCFGDFGFPIYQILQSRDVWSIEPPSNYTPLVTIMFGEFSKIVGNLGWNVAITLYLLMIAVPIWSVILIALRHLEPFTRLVISYILAFLSPAVLITLDRGNSVGLIVFPLYMFFNKLQTDSKWSTAGWGVLAISIRPQCALILILLLICKKYRDFCKVLAGTLAAYTVAFLLWDYSNLTENIIGFLRSLIGYANLNIGTIWPYNYSFSNALGIFNKVLSLGISNSTVSLLGMTFGLIVICFVWLAGRRVEFEKAKKLTIVFVWLLPFGYLLPSVSYGYYTCFALLALVIIINQQVSIEQLGFGSYLLGIVFISVLSATLSLFALPIGPSYPIGRINLFQSVICGIWLIPYLLLSLKTLRFKKDKANSTD